MSQDYSEIANLRAHRIITKRLEPYDVIEGAKKYYDVIDYTFNGRNKFEIMAEFLSELNSQKIPSAGLYMKNVNKFYLLKIKNNPDKLSDIQLLNNLVTNEYKFTGEEQINSEGITYSRDIDFAIEQIDIGKAEASFILKSE